MVSRTHELYSNFWNIKTKEKVKQYSNIKFDLDDDNPKNNEEEDRFYFEYIGLPVEVTKNVDIESIFD